MEVQMNCQVCIGGGFFTLFVPHDGAMCDLLWSDPEDVVDGWALSLRDTDFLFGNTNISLFNHTNNTDYICRAHQLVMEGYK
ncbi:hypothetical protein GOBAR_DD06197 [Gossypium barbadense]|nr:hypothetical protein GOBAR_DD06197 [Gossypium barbadense]